MKAAGLAVLLAMAIGCADPASDALSRDASTHGDGSTSSFDDAGTGKGDASADGAGSPDAALDATKPLGPLVAYASGYGPSIARYSVDPTTGALVDAGSVASFGTSPSFLAVDPSVTHLYAVDEAATGKVGAYAIDPASGALTFLNSVSSGGNGPAFVGVDATGAYVFVANYGDGTVSVLPVQAGGLGDALDTRSVGANAHMIVADPSNHFVFVPCKGADYVAQFLFDAATGALAPNAVPNVATAAGAGPRHLAFHPNGKLAYLINENASTMTAYAFDTVMGRLTEIETKSTLPAGFAGSSTGAEVWVHPSGAWVVGSNRGDDSLVVFAIDAATGKMTLVGHTKSGGATPRDFTFDPTGDFLYAANQGADDVVSFRFDAAHGTLAPSGAPVAVIAASVVAVVRLAAE